MTRERHVEVFRDEAGWWRFRLVGANGEKQDASQAYHGSPGQSKYGARRGAAAAHPGVPIRVVES